MQSGVLLPHDRAFFKMSFWQNHINPLGGVQRQKWVVGPFWSPFLPLFMLFMEPVASSTKHYCYAGTQYCPKTAAHDSCTNIFRNSPHLRCIFAGFQDKSGQGKWSSSISPSFITTTEVSSSKNSLLLQWSGSEAKQIRLWLYWAASRCE